MPTRKTAAKAARTTAGAPETQTSPKKASVRLDNSKRLEGRGTDAKPAGPKQTSEAARPVRKPASKSASPAAQPPIEAPIKTPKRKPTPPAGRTRTVVSEPLIAQPNRASDDATAPADLVDSQLARYRSMRDFNITAEPAGAIQPANPKAVLPRSKPASAGLPFVIQKHAASHLHYDFRLGWSGVLKSWAVAKGPSYITADRRLAVQVEDHPMEYGGFEGIIPKGQYGGGTVMVWDQGTWWPQLGHENVEAGLRTGSLKFEMHGSKMRGKWTLVRMHTTRPYGGADGRWKSGSNDKPQWLLIKEHDEFEHPAGSKPLTDAEPNSALTGRTMDEIAEQSDHVWNSKETAGDGQAWFRQNERATPAAPGPANTASKSSAAPAAGPARALRIAPRPGRTVMPPGPATPTPGIPPREAAPLSESMLNSEAAPGPRPSGTVAPPRSAGGRAPGTPASLARVLEDLPPEPQPEFVQPQLAQETEQPPEGSGWFHELKLDGYRMQARKSARGVQMLTRSGLDWTYRVPAIADAIAQLSFAAGTLDGEVVVLAEDGTTNFANLQASFQNNEKHPLTFFCFDLLHLDGHNTRLLPLRERKALLTQILPEVEASSDSNDTGSPVVRLSEHLETSGRLMFEQACQLHAEGIISKRADEPYQTGRRATWLKSKCLHEQEFVITGFTLSSDGPDRIGSLLLGYYLPADAPKDAGKLIYAGRTGTGFTQKQRRELRSQLAPLESKTPGCIRVPAEARRDALWVRPELVAQVRFATWTAEDLVRQAAFLGLREDKAAAEVFREEAAPTPKTFSNQRSRQPESPAPEEAPEPAPAARIRPGTGTRTVTKALRTAGAPASLRLTHPKKILDPESGLTKQQLADYYWAVAPRMLPQIADRPLSLVRCPDGAGKPCFYQKHVNHMLPPGIGSIMVADRKGGKPEPYITLNTPDALTGLAQIGVLEVHPWGSHNTDLECPDRLIFDLDPDESLPWSAVAEAAMEVRDRLKKLNLESFLKTTGGKGLHIVAPIAPEHDFAVIKDAAHRFVQQMERANPRLYLTKMTKAARTNKIYLDYLRNERGATAVAPFSPRARSGVPASVPLDWKELANPERPHFPVSGFAEWSDRLRRDPWKRITTLQQSLDLERLRTLGA